MRVASGTPKMTVDRVFANMVVNIIGARVGNALGQALESIEKKAVQAVAGNISAEISTKIGFTVAAEASDKAVGYVSET